MNMATNSSINKYLPIALLYFFFNGFLLPHGLLYTTILTPLLLLWLHKFPIFKLIKYFFIIFIPFVVVHLINGVNLFYYLRSFLVLFSAFVFSLCVYQFLTECKTLRLIYRDILLINAPLVCFALIMLFMPSLKSEFWYTNEITPGFESVRLQMFTYEPSYYSLLFVPIALYYYLKLLILKLPNPTTVLLLLTIPLLLSLSFGVILGIMLSLGITLLWGAGIFFRGKNVSSYFFIVFVFLCLAIFIMLIFFEDSVFVVRIANVFSGKDISFRGRTFDSFYLGWEIAAQKSIWWGCGFGQVKEIGTDIFNTFYNTSIYTAESVGIPNAMGDTLATLGIVGVFLRIFLEVFFFFKTKVYSNYYRLSLFAFIFIYQFTGSFITNIAEYSIWMIAFHKDIFEEFDKVKIRISKLREAV